MRRTTSRASLRSRTTSTPAPRARIDNTRDLASPFSEFAGVTVVAGLLYFGGTLILGGQSTLTGETFIGYIILFSQVLTPAKALSSSFGNIQRGLVAGERVLSIIDTEPTMRDRPDATVLPPFEREIELRNLQFSYGDTPVLLRHQPDHQKGPDRGAGGQQRRRQKHPGRPAAPLLRPQRRPDSHRRPRPARLHPALGARPDGHRHPGKHPVQRHHFQQHPLQHRGHRSGGN